MNTISPYNHIHSDHVHIASYSDSNIILRYYPALLTTCLLWNAAKRLCKNKIKTTMEITLQHLIFNMYCHFVCISLLWCCHLTLSICSGPASWFMVQCFYEGFWRQTGWKRNSLPFQFWCSKDSKLVSILGFFMKQ